MQNTEHFFSGSDNLPTVRLGELLEKLGLILDTLKDLPNTESHMQPSFQAQRASDFEMNLIVLDD